MKLKNIIVENFKSYKNVTEIPISGLSVLMGANSSGKSTALQTLLVLKQTVECNSMDIDLLLSGKYITLGAFNDVINDIKKGFFKFGVSVERGRNTEEYGNQNVTTFIWKFCESTDKEIRLSEICCDISDHKLVLLEKGHNTYDIQIDGNDTSMSVKINNLLFNELYINYNSKFNDFFHDFLTELLLCLLNQKRSFLEKNRMACLRIVENFYFELMRKGKNRGNVQYNEKDRKNAMALVRNITEAIEKYSRYQFKYYKNFNDMPEAFKENMLFNCICANKNNNKIKEILTKYEKMFEENIKNEYSDVKDCSDEFDINMVYRLGSEEKGINPECDIISDAFRVYLEVVRNIFAKIFYVGPIREKPQGLYNVGFETIPKYVGTTGAYFASVLLRENKEKEYILPNNEAEKMSLLEALDEWAVHLNVASEIVVEKKNSFGFSVSVCNTQRQKSDIMNVGIGTSQVLPVLITGLLSEVGEYLLFEQPELHLHPYSQSRLADFFVELVKRGRKIIVETHSEYFVLRMRYQILVNNIDEKNIVVNFFQNKKGTQISQGKLSGYGNLQYPDDFRDETQKLLDDLVNAALEKRKK